MTTRTLKWVLLAVLGFVGGYCVLLTLCASVSFMKAGRLWVREWTEPPIPVEEPVTLRIQHTVGEIHLRAAETDAVTVRVRAEVRTWWPSTARSLLEAMDVRVYRQGGEIVVEDVMPLVPGGQTKSLDLDITVPRHTSVVLVHDVGRVVLEDLQGLVRLDVAVGEVRLQNVTLTAGSRISTEVGRIRFQGALPQEGKVEMRTEVGALSLVVQSEHPFRLQAETDVGAVDFRSPDGRRVHGKGSLELDAGPSPALLLVLETDTGTIDVRWQGAAVHGETSEGR